MKKYLISKTLVIGIIIIFVLATFVQGINSKEETIISDKKNEVINTEAWWDNNWLFRKQITIEHTKVNDTLSNFPVLIHHTSSDLADHAQIDGDDFVFVSYDRIKLAHEIEYYDDTNGELISWVNIPTLLSTEDTRMYMYYGNPSCSNQQSPEQVWNNDFVMVQHMNDETDSKIADSTFYHNDGDKDSPNNPSEVDGKIGKGQDFHDDRIIIPYNESLFNNQMTLSFWGKSKSTGYYNNGYVYGMWESITDDRMWAIIIRSSEDDWRIITSPDGSNTIAVTTDYSVTTKMECFIFTVDNINRTWDFYLNGVFQKSLDSYFTFTNQMSDLTLGGLIGSSINDFLGILDEVRFSKIQRSSSWISTEFNNQNDPYSFMTFGLEEGLYIIEINEIDGGLFRIGALITNTGYAEASDINCNITLDGGTILLGRETKKTITNLPSGDSKIVNSKFILGFGRTLVTVSATTSLGVSDSKDVLAQVFLLFIII